MKWKDNGPRIEGDGEQVDPYYENGGYDVLGKNEKRQTSPVEGNARRYRHWGIGVVIALAVVSLIVSIFSNLSGQAKSARINALIERIDSLEQQMKEMDAAEEKVTRIWESAKEFETFKTRFDRSEASTSLRMDHLAMSLDELQKKTDDSLLRVAELEKRATVHPKTAAAGPSQKMEKGKQHTVVAGDTLYSISRKYGLSMDQLRALNNLKGDVVLHVGQTLVVR